MTATDKSMLRRIRLAVGGVVATGLAGAGALITAVAVGQASAETTSGTDSGTVTSTDGSATSTESGTSNSGIGSNTSGRRSVGGSHAS